MLIFAFAIAFRCSGVALSLQSEPAALQSSGVSGCGARVIDVTTAGDVNTTQVRDTNVPICRVSLEVEAGKASGHVEDGDDITGCQFVSSVIGLVEQYAAHQDLSYVNFIVRGEPELLRAVENENSKFLVLTETPERALTWSTSAYCMIKTSIFDLIVSKPSLTYRKVSGLSS